MRSLIVPPIFAAVFAILFSPVHTLVAEPAMKVPAPALIIETARGENFDLAAMRGKVILVNFWATWCAPCIAELPAIGKFYQAHRAQGFEVIALSIDEPRDRAKMQRLIAKLPFASALLGNGDAEQPLALGRRDGFGGKPRLGIDIVCVLGRDLGDQLQSLGKACRTIGKIVPQTTRLNHDVVFLVFSWQISHSAP